MQRHIYVQSLQSPIQFSSRKIAEKPRCVARRSTIKELHYKTVHFFLGKGDTEVELCWKPAAAVAMAKVVTTVLMAGDGRCSGN